MQVPAQNPPNPSKILRPHFFLANAAGRYYAGFALLLVVMRSGTVMLCASLCGCEAPPGIPQSCPLPFPPNSSAERDAGTCTHSGLMAAGSHSESIAAAHRQFLLPLGERVALSGPLTRDTWLGQPSRSGPWLPESQCPGTATQGGGAFALRAPLSTTWELEPPLRRFYCGSERHSQRYQGQLRHTESCKPNKTKQNLQKRKGTPRPGAIIQKMDQITS